MKRRKLVDILFEDAVPGNSPPDKQVHVFDFDDTLGLTKNANGIMVYKDGEPLFKDAAGLKKYLAGLGVRESDYLEAGIKMIPSRKAPAAYLSSAGLARVQKVIPKEKQGAVGQKTEKNVYEKDGTERLLIDFTPSSSTDIQTTEPIRKTVDKLKKANSQGSDTIVITARQATGPAVDLNGDTVTATNGKDMERFLASQGAAPTDGVMGVVGQNKGTAIINKYLAAGEDSPEEIHFYDDLKKNTDEVEAAVAGQVPAELHVYGPGEFAHDEADPERPNKSFDASEDLDPRGISERRRRESAMIMERWSYLAGIKR